jgi:predicted acetyltransferase
MPHFARPSKRYIQSFIAATREFHAEGRYQELDIHALEQHFGGFVRRWLEREHTPRPGMVLESLYWLVEGDEFLGRVSIRHELTPTLLRFGGHIGYEVRPTQRCKGYGTACLRLALPEARRLGLRRVLVTCDTTNIGSRKIIEANGGQLQDVIQNDFRDVPTMRWWIDLG